MTFASWQVGELVWAMLWFTLFFFWIYTVVIVFADVFRSPDLSGVAKAMWTLFVLFLPVLGVCAYLIARGDKITQHAADAAREQDAAMRAYIRSTVDDSAVQRDDLATLADLRDRGILSAEEFEAMRAKAGV